ncbi:MAG: P1 family peptidase [Rhodobacteraceae bacterium]|nr:P1 family peptidase [Paracoccaceae bacterium]
MKNLITDIAGLRVGNASDDALKSGVTVLTGDRHFTAGVHVMGGAPGTRETDLLAPDRLVQEVDALVLSGGSAFGLAAADGVAMGLRADGRGFPAGPATVPIVPAAILFDLANGDQSWTENPYPALGRAAYHAAGDTFDLGSVGAGCGATVAGLAGGLGSASTVTASGHTVGALVAMNAIGSVCDEEGRFWAAPFEENAEFGGQGTPPRAPKEPPTKLAQHNTTIAIVATDAKLTQAQCTRIAVAAHDGMARAILPSHTLFDGDAIFCAATGDKPSHHPVADAIALGHAAATTLARAIARGVHTASGPDAWKARYG